MTDEYGTRWSVVSVKPQGDAAIVLVQAVLSGDRDEPASLTQVAVDGRTWATTDGSRTVQSRRLPNPVGAPQERLWEIVLTPQDAAQPLRIGAISFVAWYARGGKPGPSTGGPFVNLKCP